MSEVSTKRRRRVYVLVALSLLLLAAFFWRGPRPLDPAERRMVGHWRPEDTAAAPGFTMLLTADRRFRLAPSSGYPLTVGEWRLEGDRLLVEEMEVYVAALPNPTPDQRIVKALQRVVGNFRGRPRSASLWTTVRSESNDSFRAEDGIMVVPTLWLRDEGSRGP